MHPWVPSYFGSYEHLLHELLHNPFLGSRHPYPHLVNLAYRTKPQPDPWSEQVRWKPEPDPWITGLTPGLWKTAAASLLQQISLIELTAALPEEQRAETTKALRQSIADEIDDICGNRPRYWPRWPGPPPWALQIASEVAVIANTLQEGSLKREALKVAVAMVQQAFTARDIAVAEAKPVRAEGAAV